MAVTMDDLRRYAVARSLFAPTTLKRAVHRLGIRAGRSDSRAGARAGPDAAPSRRGTIAPAIWNAATPRSASKKTSSSTTASSPTSVHALMHPRGGSRRWPRSRARHVEALLEFVRERGEVHPREVDAHFAHGTVTNYWGGSSNATTHLLDGMHYRGLLRVVRRERGIRIYAVHDHAPLPLDHVVATAAARCAGRRRRPHLRAVAWGDAVVADQPSALRRAAVAARAEAGAAAARASGSRTRASTASTGIGRPTSRRDRRRRRRRACVCSRRSIRWSGIAGASSCSGAGSTASRPTRRSTNGRLGYYALPLLWRDRVIGWANVSVTRPPSGPTSATLLESAAGSAIQPRTRRGAGSDDYVPWPWRITMKTIRINYCKV